MAKNKADNLIQNKDTTPSERRRNAKKAGIKSGEVRREKKTMKETLEFILAADRIPTGNKAISNIKNAMLAFGYDESEINMKTLFGFSIYLNAISGKSPKYSELVLGIIGEMPSDKLELTGANGAPINPQNITVNFTDKPHNADK